MNISTFRLEPDMLAFAISFNSLCNTIFHNPDMLVATTFDVVEKLEPF
jgi:hypothetical protein